MSRAAAARHFSPPLRGHSSELSNTDNLPRPQLLLLYHRSSKNSPPAPPPRPTGDCFILFFVGL